MMDGMLTGRVVQQLFASVCVAAVALSLTACNLGMSVRAGSSGGGGLAAIPFGSELVLNKPLSFPVDTTRLYFQNGRLITASQLTVWDHHCFLKLDEPLTRTLQIEPGRFTVVRTRQEEDSWGRRNYQFITRLFLSSPDTPRLTQLHCEIWNDYWDPDYHIRTEELPQVLGEYARLVIKAPGGRH